MPAKYTYVSGTVAERLLAHSVISDECGDPPQDEPCLLTTYALNDSGYGVIMMPGGKTSKTHIQAYLIWCGAVPKGKKVTHLCNVRRCFRPSHLVAATQRENLLYMAACGRSVKGRSHPGGRYPRGEARSNSKLNPLLVRQIRFLLGMGVKQRQVAERYGISQAQVHAIGQRRQWAHVA